VRVKLACGSAARDPKPPYEAAQRTDAEGMDCAAQGVGLGRFAWRWSFQKQTCFFSSAATAIFLP
jgi:hypothetical protein